MRTIYSMLQPDWIGSNRFEKLLIKNGYRLKRRISFCKTTRRGGRWREFSNLVNGLLINNINQVWVTDITYFLVNGKFCYIFLLMDVYSRRILGHKASLNMYSVTAFETLKMALKNRKIQKYNGSLIHHSDRGSQYMSDVYIKLVQSKEILISICHNVYENAHMERVNGIIKNHYLIFRTINNLEDLKIELDRAVIAYNVNKPHDSLLKKMSPYHFEKHILSLNTQNRPMFNLYRGSCKK